MEVSTCCGVILSQLSWSSRVPTKSSTYFIGILLNPYDERGRPESTRLALWTIDDGTDLHGARPLLGHDKRLVQVGHLDDREAADHLFGLDERSVGHRHPAVLLGDRGRGARTLELVAADHLAVLVVLLKPAAGLLVVGHHPVLLGPGQRIRALHRAAEQHHVLHAIPPSSTTNGRPPARHQDPVNSGSCLERKLMIPIAASVLIDARAKFSDSMARAWSRGRSKPRCTASLIIPMANVADFASRAASSSTASVNSTGASALSTQPAASASRADRRVDSRRKRIALAFPIRRGRRWVPPAPGMMPS